MFAMVWCVGGGRFMFSCRLLCNPDTGNMDITKTVKCIKIS